MKKGSIAPQKLNGHVIRKAERLAREGNFRTQIANALGVHYETFRHWLLKGEEQPSGIYHELWERVTKAEAEHEAQLVSSWMNHTEQDWRAAQTMLERRHPDRWGQKTETKISQEVTVKTEVDTLNRLLAALGYNPLGSLPVVDVEGGVIEPPALDIGALDDDGYDGPPVNTRAELEAWRRAVEEDGGA